MSERPRPDRPPARGRHFAGSRRPGRLGLLAMAALLAASAGATAQAAQPPPDEANMIGCTLTVERVSEAELALVFTLTNLGDTERRATAYYPFVAFDLTVLAGDQPLTLVEPSSDIGLQPYPLVLAPGETLRLDTPIHLRFDATGASSDDEFVWTIVHAPAAVALRAAVHIEGLDVAPCEARFDPSADAP